MTVKQLNPENTMLQQADGQWAKFAMLILWKLNGSKKVTITADDMKSLREHFEPGIPYTLIHGHSDSIDFQIVTEDAAWAIAAHDASLVPKNPQ